MFVGQTISMFGQTGRGGAQGLITTVVEEKASQAASVVPVSISTKALYEPGATPDRSQVTAAPSPTICPELMDHLYLMGLPAGEVARALSWTRDKLPVPHALTTAVLELTLRLGGV